MTDLRRVVNFFSLFYFLFVMAEWKFPSSLHAGTDTRSLTSSVQLLSHNQLFCNPMVCSTLGFPVHHHLLELTQTHVNWIGDVIPFSFYLQSSQHQGLFQWVSYSHQVAKVLELQLQHQSFQWIFRTDFCQDWLVGFPCSPRDSQESSPTPQFKSINSLPFSFLYSPSLISIHEYWKNP